MGVGGGRLRSASSNKKIGGAGDEAAAQAAWEAATAKARTRAPSHPAQARSAPGAKQPSATNKRTAVTAS